MKRTIKLIKLIKYSLVIMHLKSNSRTLSATLTKKGMLKGNYSNLNR
jgi:hypothetical protein